MFSTKQFMFMFLYNMGVRPEHIKYFIFASSNTRTKVPDVDMHSDLDCIGNSLDYNCWVPL